MNLALHLYGAAAKTWVWPGVLDTPYKCTKFLIFPQKIWPFFFCSGPNIVVYHFSFSSHSHLDIYSSPDNQIFFTTQLSLHDFSIGIASWKLQFLPNGKIATKLVLCLLSKLPILHQHFSKNTREFKLSVKKCQIILNIPYTFLWTS